MKTMIIDAPQGRVHIDQSTGQPARWFDSKFDPGVAAFFQERGWQTTVPDGKGGERMLTWDDLTKEEQKLYKRQYPVV